MQPDINSHQLCAGHRPSHHCPLDSPIVVVHYTPTECAILGSPASIQLRYLVGRIPSAMSRTFGSYKSQI
jgi:hypothetical protein